MKQQGAVGGQGGDGDLDQTAVADILGLHFEAVIQRAA